MNLSKKSPTGYFSATNLQGVRLANRDTYAWFREREPDDSVGYSILIYRVEETPVVTEWLAVWETPSLVPAAWLATWEVPSLTEVEWLSV